MAGEDLGVIRGKIEIEYDDSGVAKGVKGLGNLEDKSGKATSTIAGLFGGMAAGIGLHLAGMVVDAAKKIGSMVTDSIKSFGNFEQGMNEVFTLIPGMSEKAMGEMTKDTLRAAKQMRVLPEDVVPSLYSALSAGVPPDNVFDFLISSNKLAKGGATDLDTAVSTLAATTNAYGDDVISAEEVSDILFTTVKGGITTVDELGSSLYNVVPTAASLGVGFDQVGAALSTMTAQGTPTAQATTQLRQLMVELSKDGGKAAKTFEDIAGKSFQDFIAEGGNVQDALGLMEGAAESNNVRLSDLFSSVEAGNAALALTGSGAEMFTEQLAAQQDAAGATDAAYEQMATGINHAWDGVKVTIDAFVKEMMLRFAPTITRVLENVGAAFEWLTNSAVPALQSMRESIEKAKTPIMIVGGLIAAVFIPHLIALGVQALISAGRQAAAWLITQAGALKAAAVHSATLVAMIARWAWAGVKALVHAGKIALAWLISLGPIGLLIAAIAAVVAAFVWLWNNVEGFRNFFKSVGSAIAGVAKWLWNNGIKPVIDFIVAGFKRWMEVVTWLWNSVIKPVFAAIQGAFKFVWSIIQPILSLIWGGIRMWADVVLWLWRTVISVAFKAIQSYFKMVGAIAKWLWSNAIQPAFKAIGAIAKWLWNNAIKPAFDRFIALVKKVGAIAKWLWTNAIQPAFKLIVAIIKAWWTAAKSAFDRFIAIAKTVINAVKNLATNMRDRFLSMVDRVRAFQNRVRDMASAVSGRVKAVIGFFKNLASGIRDRVKSAIDVVKGIPGRIKSALSNVGSLLTGAGKDLIRGLIGGIKDMAGNAAQAAKDAVKGAVDGAKNILRISSPSKVMRDEIGKPVMQGLAWGIANNARLAERSMSEAMGVLPKYVPTINANVTSGNAGVGSNNNFGPGSIVLDMSKLKSIEDVVKAVERLKPTARQFVRK